VTSTYIGLDAILRRVRDGLEAGVRRSSRKLAGESADEAPYDQGTLSGGITADAPRWSGRATVEAKVHTGPGADEYAIIQHQRRKGVHYIGDPLIAHATEHVDTVGDEVRRRL
jgi:hypothetical protein